MSPGRGGKGRDRALSRGGGRAIGGKPTSPGFSKGAGKGGGKGSGKPTNPYSGGKGGRGGIAAVVATSAWGQAKVSAYFDMLSNYTPGVGLFKVLVLMICTIKDENSTVHAPCQPPSPLPF